MDPRAGTVECPEHGTSQATFVCQHIAASLRTRKPVGFFTAEADGYPRPDAWCAACEEQVWWTEGEWTDQSEAFAGVTMICGECYDRASALNSPEEQT